MNDAVKTIVGAVLTIGSFFIPGGTAILTALRAVTLASGTALLSSGLAPEIKRQPLRREFRVSPVQATDAPEPFIVGQVRTSGVFVFPPRTSGLDGEFLWYCIAFTREEITSYEKLYIDGTEIDIATQVDIDGYVTHSNFADSDDKKLVRVKFYRGLDGQLSDPWLQSAFPTFWTASHKLDGVAYMVMRLELDQSKGGNDPDSGKANVWESGIPQQVSVLMKGRKFYDPAKDSTNGGVGAHRYDDPATWEYTNNAILVRRGYMTNTRVGAGVSNARIDDAITITQAAIAQEAVNVWDGLGGQTTQERWSCDGIAYSDEARKSVVEAMAAAAVGETCYHDGKYGIYAGAYETPTHTIDESWYAGSWKRTVRGGRKERYNAVGGRFIDPARAHTSHDFEPLTNATWEAADGGQFQMDLSLPFVNNNQRGQRVGKVWHNRSRYMHDLEFLSNLRALAVKPMDVAEIDLPEIGLSAGTYRCIGWDPQENGGILLTLRKEQSSDYALNYATDLTEPPAGTSMTTATDETPTASGLTATGIPGGNSVEWSNPDMTRISHVEVWGSQTNDRATASQLTQTRGEDYIHVVPAGQTWYYWVITRGTTLRPGPWHPVSTTAGVSATSLEANAVTGFCIPEVVQWIQAPDGGAWDPLTTTSDLDFTFQIGGTAAARIARRVTRDANGLLTVSTTTHSGGDLNLSRVTITVIDSGTPSVIVKATYSHDGKTYSVSQPVSAIKGGSQGTDGEPGLDGGLLRNGSFETGDFTGWTGGTDVINSAANARSGSYYARVACAAGGPNLLSDLMAAEAGQKYRIQGYMARDTSLPNANGTLRVRWYNSSQALLSTSTVGTALSSTSGWQHLSGTVTAPANTKYMRLDFGESNGTTGFWRCDDARIDKGGELADKDTAGTDDIDDDAVTTPKILSGDVQQVANAYTATVLAYTGGSGYQVVQFVDVGSSTGEPIRAQFSFLIQNGAAGQQLYTARVQRFNLTDGGGGTTIDDTSGQTATIGSSGETHYNPVTMLFDDPSPPAGKDLRYSFQIQSTQNKNIYNRKGQVWEFKTGT